MPEKPTLSEVLDKLTSESFSRMAVESRSTGSSARAAPAQSQAAIAQGRISLSLIPFTSVLSVFRGHGEVFKILVGILIAFAHARRVLRGALGDEHLVHPHLEGLEPLLVDVEAEAGDGG